MAIHEVGRAQAELLAAIHRDCFPNYWSQEAFTGFFNVTGTMALVAEVGGQPAGMIVCRLQFDEAEVLTLAVRPEFRRQGLARALLEEAMRKAAAFGSRQMFLDVEEGNCPAISLYESKEFSLLRRRKQYYRQKDGSFTDALVMKRKLA